MTDRSQKYLRKQLVKHLEGGEAFTPIDVLLKKIPLELAGKIPEGLPYSLWQQLYHIRFAQHDILEFSTNPDYQHRNWPDDYWPDKPAPASQNDWDDMIATYYEERMGFLRLVEDNETDLFKPFPHGDGQTLLREAMLIIEHTAYHTGEMLVIMRMLGIHP